MNITQISILCLSAMGTIASGDIMTQSFEYAVDFEAKDEFRSLAQFDTQGGTRELTGVQFRLNGTYSLDYVFENGSFDPLGADQYNPSPNVFANLIMLNAKIELGPIATDYTAIESQNLTGADGVAGSGTDSMFVSIDGTIGGSTDVSQADLGAFVGNGSLLFEQFFFASIDLPLGVFAGVQFQENYHTGTLDVEYTYTTVPAPGALAMGLIGMGTLTRRRRSSK